MKTLSLITLVAACGGSSSAPSDTVIGLSGITNTYETSAEAYRQLLDAGSAAGVELLHFQVAGWSETETAPESYDFEQYQAFLAMRGDYGLRYTLDIGTPLGLLATDVPAGMMFSSFDDPELLRRYRGYVSATLNTFGTVSHVVLHTETAGAYFDLNPDQRAGYLELLDSTVEHIHDEFPGIKVGIYGGKNESAELLADMNRSTDFFGITVLSDRGDVDYMGQLNALVALAGDKPIAVVETGIPSAARVGGSEAGQAAHVNAMFDFAESHELEFLSYYQVFDENQEVTRQYAPALFPDWNPDDLEDFIVWISSLGLRRTDDTPKPAWTAFAERMARRR